MRFALLGPLEVRSDDGSLVDVGGRQPRIVLALLLLHHGRAVRTDALVEAIWGDRPPPSATGTLQSYVSRIRRTLDGSSASLLYDAAGYRLDVAADDIDVDRFERLVEEGQRRLRDGAHAEAVEALAEADSLWRGPAIAELSDVGSTSGAAVRLEESRLAALEARVEAELTLGRHAHVVGELSERVSDHPLRERLHAQLALALYRSGRQADALRVLSAASRTLREELGIEPGRPMRDLEAAILDHDPSLDPSDEPVAARSAADLPSASEAPPPTADLVGRVAELGQLLDAFGESIHSGRFVVVEGEPGIGKTRLVDELTRIVVGRGALAVWGRTDEGGAAPALWPWLEPLRAIADVAPEVPDTVTPLLAGSLPPASGGGTSAQFEQFEAVSRLVSSAASVAPVVVVLDDLQWADPASLALLAFLASRLSPQVLVVGTMRPEPAGRRDPLTDALAAIARRPGSRRLRLRGLLPEETALVVKATTAIPYQAAAAIHERAEGNPFYAIELARLASDEGVDAGQVPGTLADVIRQRLTQLPPDTVDLLGVAAVAGRDVELELVRRAEGLAAGDCLERLEPAVAHHILVQVPDRPSTLRFSHALLRDALLEDLSPLRRARLHLGVADALEARGVGPDDAEILAEHLWRAAPVGVGDRAAAALERAAEIALGRVAYSTAAVLLTRAVELRRAAGGSPEDQRAELATIERLLDVARSVWYFQGADPRLVERGKTLATQLGERERLLTLLWFAWAALATGTRTDETEAPAREIFELSQDAARPETRSVGEQLFGVWCWQAGRLTEAVAHLDRAVALREGTPPPTEPFAAEQFVTAYMFWEMLHAMAGDRPEADTFAGFDLLNSLAPNGAAIAAISCFAATTATVLGAWETVDRYRRTAIDADPFSQYAFWGGQLGMYEGILAARDGLVDEALDCFAAGKARYIAVGGRTGLASFEAAMAGALAEQGRIAQAVAVVEDARGELETYGERWNEPLVLMAEGQVAQAAGDADRAADLLRRASQVAMGQGAGAIARRVALIARTYGLHPAD